MSKVANHGVTAEQACDWVVDARERTCELVADLTDEQLMGAQLNTVNPLLWEIGHVAWFQEKWVLRETLDRPPIRDNADALWDSIAIAHDTRWNLPLPTRAETLQYLHDVRDAVLDVLAKDASDDLIYRAQYCVFHEDMHGEAFTYTRQTLNFARPELSLLQSVESRSDVGPVSGDAEVPGGSFELGADHSAPFAFDNEKWAHDVVLNDFAIAIAPVTQADFSEFVDDGGYRRRDLWGESGWEWRQFAGAEHPVYWKREDDGAWWRRDFDEWGPLEPHRPVVHVNWYEANAYCRWASRRLPTEAEWEIAAALEPPASGVSGTKRYFPWGNDAVTAGRANVDSAAMGCVDVGAFGEGDSAYGCRQMIGNVWEWTAKDFLPYPGFERDFYKEYSEPWFASRKVLRGGAWATRGRMLRNTWRNFFEPHRRDVFAGFRTCALPV